MLIRNANIWQHRKQRATNIQCSAHETHWNSFLMWWHNLCYASINGTQKGPFKEQVCKEFPGRKTNCLTFRKEIRALKWRTSTASKTSYHWGRQIEPQQIFPSVAFTLQDADYCPSWWWFGTQLPEVCIPTTLGHHLHSCMLQETFLYQLWVLLLQSVSIKHHLLSSRKKSPVDCFLHSRDPASSCLAQPPLSSYPHSPIYLGYHRCRTCLLQILLLIESFQAECSTPFPLSTFLSREQGQAAREPPKIYPSRGGNLHISREEKPLQRGLTFIYLFRRKAALCGCVHACVCQDNRKKAIGGVLPGNSRPSALVQSSFSSSFVLRGMYLRAAIRLRWRKSESPCSVLCLGEEAWGREPAQALWLQRSLHSRPIKVGKKP